jgi:hypothetical protein
MYQYQSVCILHSEAYKMVPKGNLRFSFAAACQHTEMTLTGFTASTLAGRVADSQRVYLLVF